jgi:hypothetical protein
MSVWSNQMERSFWEDVWKKAEEEPEPSGDPYQALRQFFRTPQDIGASLKAAAKAETSHDSTHPALPDRVAALQEKLSAPVPLTVSAAEKYLGELLEMQLIFLFDKSWRQRSRKPWKSRYQQHQAARATVGRLQSAPVKDLSREDLSRLVTAVSVLKDDRRIMLACQEILKREPDNGAAKAHLLGLKLVNDSDESALLKLDELARENTEHTPTVCHYALRHLNRQGRLEEAKVYQFRLDEWEYQKQAADEERNFIFPGDEFLPHDIKPEYVAQLAKVIGKYGATGRAWMVRKKVTYMKDQPVFVIGLKPKLGVFKNHDAALADIKKAVAQSGLPPFFQFFWVGSVKGLETRLKKVAGSRIYG